MVPLIMFAQVTQPCPHTISSR